MLIFIHIKHYCGSNTIGAYCRQVIPLLLIVMCCACSTTSKGCLAINNPPPVSLYIVKIEGHTGLVFSSADVKQQKLPETADLEGMDFYKVGWGDFDYYQANDPSIWLGLKALFWPTDSVIHLVGIRGQLEKFFSDAQIIELELSTDAFSRIMEFVSDSFERNGNKKADSIKSERHYNGYFYRAKGRFYLFHTCNSWIAEALKAGGCDLTPRPICADSLFKHLLELRTN